MNKIDIDKFVCSLCKHFSKDKRVATLLSSCLKDQGVKYVNTPDGWHDLIKIQRFESGDIIEFNGFGHNRYTIKDVCGLSHYINSDGGRMDMAYTDANFKLVEQRKKCIYSEDNYTDEDRKTLCDGCEEECVLKQKHVEWSKEDKNMLEDTIYMVTMQRDENRSDNEYQRADKCINWLKFHFPKMLWKPTKEQLEALKFYINQYVDKESIFGKDIISLYEQLKAL